jgi:hypothetical protein
MKLARTKRKALVRPPSLPRVSGMEHRIARSDSARCLTPSFSHSLRAWLPDGRQTDRVSVKRGYSRTGSLAPPFARSGPVGLLKAEPQNAPMLDDQRGPGSLSLSGCRSYRPVPCSATCAAFMLVSRIGLLPSAGFSGKSWPEREALFKRRCSRRTCLLNPSPKLSGHNCLADRRACAARW